MVMNYKVGEINQHLLIAYYILGTMLGTLGIQKKLRTPAGVAQWIECWPMNQKVASLIPSQGTCLGCGPDPQ